MQPKYKRLTLEEARAVARAFLDAEARAHLPPDVVEEMAECAAEGAGSVLSGWEAAAGFTPDPRRYYEFEWYKPSRDCPYVDKIYARILVSRDRDNPRCFAAWQPEAEPHEGPPFT